MPASKSNSVSVSVVVGIAGGSASGKTTFTATLMQAFTNDFPDLRVQLFGMDKYFYRGAPGGPLFVSPSSGEVLPNNNHPNSADNAKLTSDLEALRTSADCPSIIIVEGLMTLHIPEIRSMLNVKLYIDLPPDIRALRRLLRDMKGGRGNTDPEWIATYYRECARVGHETYIEPSRAFADLIIRGDSDFDVTAPLVAAAIASRI